MKFGHFVIFIILVEVGGDSKTDRGHRKTRKKSWFANPLWYVYWLPINASCDIQVIDICMQNVHQIHTANIAQLHCSSCCGAAAQQQYMVAAAQGTQYTSICCVSGSSTFMSAETTNVRIQLLGGE